jgi:hypothetical protein
MFTRGSPGHGVLKTAWDPQGGARRAEVMFTNLVEILVSDVLGIVSHARGDLVHGRHPLTVPRAVPLDKVIARPRRRSPQVPDAKGRPHKHDRTRYQRHLRTLGYCSVWVSWSRLRSTGESLACLTHLEASSTPQVTLTDFCRSVRTSCCSVASTPMATWNSARPTWPRSATRLEASWDSRPKVRNAEAY